MSSLPQGAHETYEWLEWCARAATKHQGGKSKSQQVFYGCSLSEALKMARGEGWQAAVPDAERYAERVSSEVMLETHQQGFTSSFDTSGAEVDIARFLSGEPECMMQSLPLRIAKQGRAVRIVVPSSYSGSTPVDQVRKRGAAICALAQILARAQHPLEIWSAFCNNGTRYRHSFVVRVQRANEPLDEGRVMYALAHETANRRLCFSVKEQSEWYQDLGTGSYGRAPRTVYLDDLPDDQANTIIVEDFDVRPYWDERHAVAWIIGQLDTLGLL
jgi:hypothetical protein